MTPDHQMLKVETHLEAIAIVKQIITDLLDHPSKLDDDTPLIGEDALLDSMKLVELCLALEDHASECNFEFDWTSPTTMSRSQSMFRTISSLSEEFASQANR